jgi:hypothetical protein
MKTLFAMTSLFAILYQQSILSPAVPQQAGTGAVTGQIRLISRAAAMGVRVSVMTVTDSVESNEVTVLDRITQTDRQGRYRLENVPPGRYFIVAGDLSAPTYYPGTSLLKDARIVTIAAGSIVDAIDFQILRLPVAPVMIPSRVPEFISGKVVLEGGRPLPLLLPLYVFAGANKTFIGPDGVRVRGGGTFGAVPVERNGAFRLSLEDGEYAISLITSLGDPPGQDDGYYVKSIVSGASDLMTDKLKIVARKASPITITLAPR